MDLSRINLEDAEAVRILEKKAVELLPDLVYWLVPFPLSILGSLGFLGRMGGFYRGFFLTPRASPGLARINMNFSRMDGF